MAQFEGLGVEFVEAELPPELPYYKIIEGVVFGEGSASFRELIESDRLDLVTDEDQRTKMRETLSMPAYVYLDAMRDRERVRAAFDAIFRDVDAIFTYTLPWEPHPIVGEFTPVNPTQGFTGHGRRQQPRRPAGAVPAGRSHRRISCRSACSWSGRSSPRRRWSRSASSSRRRRTSTRCDRRCPTPQPEPALAGR